MELAVMDLVPLIDLIGEAETALVGGVVLLIALRPAGIGTWLGRGLLAWQLLHRLRGAPLIPEEPR